MEDQTAPKTRQGSRVLVVDDYDGVRQFLRDALERQGYHVRLASNGCEALAMFIETPADVIITDYEMPPFLNGIGLIKIVKALRPDTVAILLTGASCPQLIADADAVGAHEVIQKPCDLAIVVRRVEEIRQDKASS
jgi:DNA-binding NtrC family response regulator